MLYVFNGKNINIPDRIIEKNMTLLNVPKEEAIQIFLEDEGYLINKTVEKLTEKAKINKINHEAKSDKPRKVNERKRKPDEEKEYLIKILANCLKDKGYKTKITNQSKIIEFYINENHYKLDLIKQRPPKNSL